MIITYKTNSPEETILLARKAGERIKSGETIAYFGSMGAGKTTFTRGLAIGMGLADEVTSPTFSLVNEYRDRSGRVVLAHFDMYRIHGGEELDVTGFYDYLDSGSAVAVEWAENVIDGIDEPYIRITINRIDDNTREITFETENGDERFADIGD